jgi:hypothetical protein
MLPKVEAYLQNGSSFHLSQEEVLVARAHITDLNSLITHSTGVDGDGRIVYTARKSSALESALSSANLKKE